MKTLIQNPDLLLNLASGALDGTNVVRTSRTVGDLAGFFRDEDARRTMPQDLVMYEVEAIFPTPEGTSGGLFFGRTVLCPGQVGEEYFMTKGHFHEMRDRGEFYWGISGNGLLLLMDEERQTRVERMFPGSLHYIPGHTAHRTVNTSVEPLVFGACWPSDAGHNYEEILDRGFSLRALNRGGQVLLSDEPLS